MEQHTKKLESTTTKVYSLFFLENTTHQETCLKFRLVRRKTRDKSNSLLCGIHYGL